MPAPYDQKADFISRTTNDLTSNISQGLAKAFGLDAVENVIELIVRCVSSSNFPYTLAGLGDSAFYLFT